MLRKCLPEELLEEPEETIPDEQTVPDGQSKAPGTGMATADEVSAGAADKAGASETDAKQYDGRLGQLQSIGLNVEDGLTYCADDEEFYMEILQEYVDSAPEKKEKLTEFLRDGNLKDYRVVVHSVKSASKTIGAQGLFEKALELEYAAGDGKQEFVTEHHPPLMEEYHALVEAISHVLSGWYDDPRR